MVGPPVEDPGEGVREAPGGGSAVRRRAHGGDNRPRCRGGGCPPASSATPWSGRRWRGSASLGPGRDHHGRGARGHGDRAAAAGAAAGDRDPARAALARASCWRRSKGNATWWASRWRPTCSRTPAFGCSSRELTCHSGLRLASGPPRPRPGGLQRDHAQQRRAARPGGAAGPGSGRQGGDGGRGCGRERATRFPACTSATASRPSSRPPTPCFAAPR